MRYLTDDMLKKIFWSLLCVIFVVMIIYTPDYGICGDDVSQHNYGKSVWAYLSTFGGDKTAVTGKYLENTQTLYGGFFDGTASMMISFFHPKDEFLFRHYWVMIFGFLGFLITGLLAKEFGGWRAAVVSVFLLFFVGRYFGEAFNNPKDIPFATTYILAVYAIVLWLKNIEQLKWKHTIYMALAVGLSLSIRIGGALLVAYLGLFYAVVVWQKKLYKDKKLSKSLKHLVVAGVIAYIGMVIWWPYALEDPLSNPFEALKIMSSYPAMIKMIFEGHRIDSSQIPWYYLPKWLSIGLPIYLLLGFIGGSALIMQLTRKFKNSFLWTIVFVVVFPVFYIVYNHSTLYDGLRHSLFIIPAMVIVATLFYIFVYDSIKSKALQYGVVALVVILIALPARFMFANHPNEYVYFNEIAGGIKNAYGIYETDYYMNSIKQGYKWLIERELNKRPANDTAIIATNCAEPFVEYEKISPLPFHTMYSRFYEKNQKDWDYAVYYGRFLDKEQLQNGYFPSSMAIHVIKADGVPLCTILKNDPERNGFKGFTAKQQNDLPSAINYFSKALTKYPEDMELWGELAETYARMGNLDSAQLFIDKALAISSLDLQTLFMAGQIAMQRRDFKKAEQVFTNITVEYPSMGQAYLQLGVAQASMGNFIGAIESVNTGIAADPSVTEQGNDLLQKIRAARGGK
ncbi:MAG: tetratricopeptide repeat protein [Flavipsychrobacter sp.]|jgi:tetratricopeptide (TPR) repeat protein|nr:tetratricopeptide repeat protein [Flavipsychrobacter sp.]